jgi:hypothetical protein
MAKNIHKPTTCEFPEEETTEVKETKTTVSEEGTFKDFTDSIGDLATNSFNLGVKARKTREKTFLKGFAIGFAPFAISVAYGAYLSRKKGNNQ